MSPPGFYEVSRFVPPCDPPLIIWFCHGSQTAEPTDGELKTPILRAITSSLPFCVGHLRHFVSDRNQTHRDSKIQSWKCKHYHRMWGLTCPSQGLYFISSVQKGYWMTLKGARHSLALSLVIVCRFHIWALRYFYILTSIFTPSHGHWSERANQGTVKMRVSRCTRFQLGHGH